MSHSVQPNGGEAAKLALCGSHPQARRAPFVEDAAPFKQIVCSILTKHRKGGRVGRRPHKGRRLRAPGLAGCSSWVLCICGSHLWTNLVLAHKCASTLYTKAQLCTKGAHRRSRSLAAARDRRLLYGGLGLPPCALAARLGP